MFFGPIHPSRGGMGRAWRLALGEEDDRHIEKDVVGRGSAVFRRRSVFHQSKPYASNISRGRGDIFLYMHLSVRSLLVVYSYSDRLLKTKELPRAVFPLWSMWDEGASAVEFDLSSHGLNGYISPNLVLLGPLAGAEMIVRFPTAVAIRGIPAVRAVLVVRPAASPRPLHNNNDNQ